MKYLSIIMVACLMAITLTPVHSQQTLDGVVSIDELRRIEKDVMNTHSTIKKLDEQINTLEARTRKEKQNLSEQERIVKALTKLFGKLTATVQELKMQRDKAEERSTAATKAFEAAKTALDEATELIKKGPQRADKLRTQIKQLRLQTQTLLDAKTADDKKVTRKQSEYDDIENHVKQTESQQEIVDAAITELEAKITVKKGELQDASSEEERIEIQTTIETLEGQKEAQQAELSALQINHTGFSKALETLKGELTKLKEAQTVSTQAYQSHVDTISNLEAEHKKLLEDIEKAKANLSDLGEHYHKAKEHAQQLKVLFEKAKAELVKAERKQGEMKKELGEAITKRDRLKNLVNNELPKQVENVKTMRKKAQQTVTDLMRQLDGLVDSIDVLFVNIKERATLNLWFEAEADAVVVIHTHAKYMEKRVFDHFNDGNFHFSTSFITGTMPSVTPEPHRGTSFNVASGNSHVNFVLPKKTIYIVLSGKGKVAFHPLNTVSFYHIDTKGWAPLHFMVSPDANSKK